MRDHLLIHKGYQGSAEISLEDDCLFGKLLFVTDLVTYEAQTVTALREAFEAAVDHYLERCSAMESPADLPPSKVDKRRQA